MLFAEGVALAVVHGVGTAAAHTGVERPSNSTVAFKKVVLYPSLRQRLSRYIATIGLIRI